MFQEIRIYFGENVTIAHILDTNSPWQDCGRILLGAPEEIPTNQSMIEEGIWTFCIISP